jgi:HAD superfamily hydrolase (TIGR01457 family)
MRALRFEDLENFSTVLCDLDGVVWREKNVIWENVNALRELKGRGKRLIFITNNSSRKADDYRKRLRELGIEADMIITSSTAAANYLVKRGIKRVYAVGEEGLFRALESNGIKICEEEPQAVVVGIDRTFNYEKLKKASNFVYFGALFVATNLDAHVKEENGILPGAGSIVSAISYASGRKPDVVIGKPNRYIFENLDLNGAVLIGDNLETDILAGKNLGIPTVFVLSGVHKLEDVERLKIEPDFYAENLQRL